MKKPQKFTLAIASILSLSTVSLAFVDNDLDGVDDTIDRCPNTPFDQIVGQDGCPIGRIGQEQEGGVKGRFYFKVGAGYNTKNSNDSTTSSVSFAYAYKGFYTSISSIYYLNDSASNSSGLGDTYFYISYSWFTVKNLYTTLGLNTKIPTGEDKFSDGYFDFTPSVNLDYIRGKDDYFVYYGRIFKGNPRLKDVDTFSIGAGYQFTRRFYSSISFDGVSSAVSGDFGYTVSYFGLYNFTKKYYGTFSYSYGLNDKALDHSVFTKFGIRF